VTDKTWQDQVADRIQSDGEETAAAVMRRAAGSPEIALGILGVAISGVLAEIDETRRKAVLRHWLASFE
jgi:hypothetical protein